MTKFFFLLSSCLLFLSCSERERANPFDPKNPETHGAPTGVRIYSLRQTVVLRWDMLEIEDLSHYLVYKNAHLDTLYPYIAIEPPTTAFYDDNVFYNRTYYYAVQALSIYDAGQISDTLKITPGPFNFIIADFYNFNLKRITYDGNYLINQQYFDSPVAIARLSDLPQFLVVDYWQSKVYLINDELVSQAEFSVGSAPIDLATDQEQRQFYVIYRNSSIIERFSLTSGYIESIKLPELMGFDSKLCYDPLLHNLWIANPQTHSILNVNLNPHPAQVQWICSLPNPQEVAADPQSGGCWIASDTGLVYLNSNRQIRYFRPGYQISAISVNPQNGDCYYSGHSVPNNLWETGRIIYGNSALIEIILGSDYPDIHGLQVTAGSGAQGFLVLQANPWHLLRINSTGEQIGYIANVSGHLELVLD
jgi:hypothetical protein